MTSEFDGAQVLDWNAGVIKEFRANGGVVGGQFAGMSLILLTTTGAKSGQQRVSPLAHTMDGDHVVICASKAGAPTNPDWYHNGEDRVSGGAGEADVTQLRQRRAVSIAALWKSRSCMTVSYV